MHVPKGAVAPLSEYGREDGIHELTFACEGGVKKKVLTFHPYPFGVGPVTKGRHYLLELWNKLDTEVAHLKDPRELQPEYHKNRATAFSEVIHMLMGDFYETRDDVVREALLRYDAEVTGNSDNHETPGLGEEHWDSLKRSAVKVAPPQQAVFPVAGKQLTAAEKEAAKNALETGMFTVEQLADMFKTTAGVIEACR